MKTTPCITVLMSVYNTERFVGDCIRSILEQTFPDFEFIIINDASTDRSVEIIKSFKDKRIRLLNNSIRSYPTRNKGLRVAKGKYICIMDADDISLPARFERQVLFMEQNQEYGLAGSGYRVLGSTQDLYRETDYEKIKVQLMRNNCFIHPSVIVRHDLLKKHKLRYIRKYFYSSDYDFIARAARFFPITNIPEILMHYRVHHNQVTMQYRTRQAELADEISVNQLRYLGIEPDRKERCIYANLLKNIPIEYSQKQLLLNFIDKIFLANSKKSFYNETELKCFFISLLSRQPLLDINDTISLKSKPKHRSKKTDLTDVTFVFPVRIDSQNRFENINALINFMSGYFKTNIRILEIDDEQHIADYEIDNNISYSFLQDSEDIFKRKHFEHKMILEAETPYVAVFDTDAIASPGQILDAVNSLHSEDAAMSFPYDRRYYSCDAVLSKIFKKTHDIKIFEDYLTNLHLKSGHSHSGGAYIINKVKYLEVYNKKESVIDNAYDCFTLVKRMEVLNMKIYYSTGPLFHLWHPKSKNSSFPDQNIRKESLKTFLEICKG